MTDSNPLKTISLEELKARLSEAEPLLPEMPYVDLATFQNESDRPVLELAVTEQLQKRCKKGKVWKSRKC